ncbi:MAG TPA: TonB family protein [Prolixibacteraceae bacterium]|nr:TonB family protein [Prolixibacteraceae bacterium]
MEAFAFYLIKSAVWLSGFALVYVLFLRNERFFTLNRIFLVSGMLISIILPLYTWHYTIVLPVIPSAEVSEPQIQGIVVAEESFPTQTILLFLYLAGLIFLIFKFFWQTLPVFRIIRKSETHQYNSAKLIRTSEYPASFSFISFVFVNPSIDEIETREIVNHELEHIRQKHWIDLLLFEILRTMQWFNPAIWLYGRLIRQNHEYLADERALQRSSNPAIYRAALLNQMFGGPVISLANSFNYSLNKKRFNMMKQTISSPIRKLKLLLVVPLMAGIFYAFSAPEYQFVQTGNDPVMQEGRSVTGKVVAEDGNPLKGASIVVSGKTIGTSTDASGNFKLELTDDSPIVISYVGYDTQKVKPDFEKEMDIILKTVVIGIDVMGNDISEYKPMEIPNSALIIIDGKESTKAAMDNLNPDKIEKIDILKNKEAIEKYGKEAKDGVILITLKNENKTSTTQAFKVQTSSPLKFRNADGSESQPLVVIDGVVAKTQNVNNIPPETIESITVLKDESASDLYGDKGKNGVVLITTKKEASASQKGKPEVAVIGYNNDLKAKHLNGSGFGTINRNSNVNDFGKDQPLVVKDGIISENMNMNSIDPNSIESMNVLKGESAISKYGEKSKNGVVEITSKPKSEVFFIVEEMPEFPGGIAALKEYVASTLQYPAIALENGIQGIVFVNFVVSKYGSVTDAKFSSGVDPSLNKEALRIVNNMPKWKPGSQAGEPVSVSYNIPIDFKLPAGKKSKISKEKLR